MDKAVEAARTADLGYFQALEPDALQKLCKKKDEDQRSLFHTACANGNLELVQLLGANGGLRQVNDEDDEV